MLTLALLYLAAFATAVAFTLAAGRRADAAETPTDRLEDDAEQSAWVASQGWAA